MRWIAFQLLKKVSLQAMLTFAAMNLKKLATWLWKSGGSKDRLLLFFIKWQVQHTVSLLVGLKQRCLSSIWLTKVND